MTCRAEPASQLMLTATAGRLGKSLLRFRRVCPPSGRASVWGTGAGCAAQALDSGASTLFSPQGAPQVFLAGRCPVPGPLRGQRAHSLPPETASIVPMDMPPPPRPTLTRWSSALRTNVRTGEACLYLVPPLPQAGPSPASTAEPTSKSLFNCLRDGPSLPRL